MNVLKDENLNTIAPIDSKSIFTEIDYNCSHSRNISLDLNNITINKNCNGKIFVILQNNNDSLDMINYYLFSFDIKEDDDNKTDYKKHIIISSILLVVLILIITFAICCRKAIKKNQDLGKQVSECSFSDVDGNSDIGGGVILI